MKGTLFSADFINDSNGNLRLLEFNTDTQIINQELGNIDYSSFTTFLSDNNITTLEIVYKPYIHTNMVQHLKSHIESNAAFITSIILHDEDINSIYPASITDSSEKFILRLAYDESAIFDSVYAKNRLNTFSLFTSSSINDYTVGYYHSSSAGIVDTISREITTDLVPDATVKDIDESFNPIDFYKIGSETSGESNTDRWNAFIEATKSEDKLIEQFHYNTSSLDENNHVTSVRYFGIVYADSGLNTIDLHSYRISSIFDLPTTLGSEYNANQYVNKLADHHYYEYTTNFIKAGSTGVLSTHKIKRGNGTWDTLGNINVGEDISSYFISGSPQVEANLEVQNWQHSGNQFPANSFLTSSRVVYKNIADLKYGGIIELVVDGDSIFTGTDKQFLIYDSGSDTTSFKHSSTIDVSEDYFFDSEGNVIDIDEANLFITTEHDLKFVELDVEDTDTYIISGSTAFNSIVAHNSPCFVAGTKITLSDGTVKEIENINAGDTVLTYNHSTDKIEPKEVLTILSKKVQNTVVYTFDNGKKLEATFDHPLYSPTLGYVSYKPNVTKESYGLHVAQLKIGTPILLETDSTTSVVSIAESNEEKRVYNLHSVKDNSNFFANQLLVHNRCFIAGTEITLGNGDVKNIEDVTIEEEVLTYNEQTGNTETGIVGELNKHEVDKVIRLTLDNSIIITTTEEHPFYVNEKGWVKAKDLKELDTCKKVSGEEAIISSVEILNEDHTVYNLLSVSNNSNFFANGILVHNK